MSSSRFIFLTAALVAGISLTTMQGCSFVNDGGCTSGTVRCDGQFIVTCKDSFSNCSDNGDCRTHTTYEERTACSSDRPVCQELQVMSGNGTVCQVSSLSHSCKPKPLDLGDLNGGTPTDLNEDGLVDYWAVSETDSDAIVLDVALARADGSFQRLPSQPFARGYGATASDVDGDGHKDLSVGDISTGPGRAVYSAWFVKGHGDGTFDAPKPVTTAGNFPLQTTADVDGDGVSDLVALDVSTVSVVRGTREGFVKVQTTISVEGDCSSYCQLDATGDVNGDGRADMIVITGTSPELIVGQKDGSFAAGPALPKGLETMTHAILADVNGDARLDLVARLNQNASLGVYLGKGDGTFAQGLAVDMLPYTSPSDVALQDVNGDGHVDLLMSDSSASVLAVRIGAGDGTFAAPTFYQPSSYFTLGPVTQTAATHGPTPVLLAVERGLATLDVAACR